MDSNANTPSGGTGSGQMDQKKVMGILAYIGPLVIVSYLVAKDDPFVKFHIKQALVLFVIEVAIWFLSSMLWGLYLVWNVASLAVLVFAVLGIVNVVQNKEKELPLLGQFAKYFPI